jgi:hypothetical protein
MIGQNIFVTFHSFMAFAPDGLRSFLAYLQELQGPVQLSGFPSNLYIAADTLAKNGGTIHPAPLLETAKGPQRSVSIDVRHDQSGHTLLLDFGPARELLDFLTSPRILDLLNAGARMTSADYALISLESEANSTVYLRADADRVTVEGAPVALWLSAQLSKNPSHLPGMIVLHEQWDGATLLLQGAGQDVHSQRRLIRGMIQDPAVGRDSLTLALTQALKAPDWEVRASAMLGAARLGLQSLGLAVKRVAIPDRGPSGVTGDVRHMLLAMHKACLLLLSGTTPPEMADERPDTRPGMQAHLLRCVAGLPVKFYEDFFLLTTALTQPLPLLVPQPAKLLQGLERHSNGIYRSRSLEFVWVPPVTCWLGAGMEAREHTPAQGYFIARWPLRTSTSEAYLQTTLPEAREVVEQYTRSQGLSLVLPSADEWEMAARGSDARLFPWGNGWQTEMLAAASPWGMRDCVGKTGQWTAEGFVCGIERDPRCATRSDQESVAAIRLKIDPLASS